MAEERLALVEQLQAAGDRCYQGEDAACDFKNVLESAFFDATRESMQDWEAVCEQLLLQVKGLLDPSSARGQALLELVGWDLPAVVARYIGISDRCRQLSLDIIECLATSCSPREILATLMEALHIYNRHDSLELCPGLLQGISVVLPRIQRRKAEFARETVAGVLSLALVAELHADDVSEANCRSEILAKLLQLCRILQKMYETEKLGEQKEELRKILVYYALVLMPVVATTEASSLSDSLLQVLDTLKFCGLTASALLDRDLVCYTRPFQSDDFQSSFDVEADCGAAFAVLVWLSKGSKDDEKLLYSSKAAVLNRLRSLFTYVLSRCSSLKFAEKAVQLTQTVLAASNDECIMVDDEMTTAASVSPMLQVIQELVVRAPSPSLRTSMYNSLLSILRRIPAGARLVCLNLLVSQGPHPSMVSLLLTFAKDEIHNAWPSTCTPERNPFTSRDVLELVEVVLRPKEGGPPKLPENLDAVVGALNLYRFILLREKSAGTNHTGIRSKAELAKAKSEWLEPLRYVIASVPPTPDPQVNLLLDSLQMIRSRCMELVEEEPAQVTEARGSGEVITG